MTRKLSISLPDDVAEHLDHVENASAYIAEAIRRQRRSERTREFFAKQGIHITDEGVARAGEKLRAAEERRRQKRSA
jgi:hypothetical protein